MAEYDYVMNQPSTASEEGVVRLVKAMEPRLQIDADRELVAVLGASNISTQIYSADSSTSGQLNWSITTPSVRVGVDRKMWIESSWDISFDAGDLAQNFVTVPTTQSELNDVAQFGPRQWPLHSVAQVFSLRLNDQQFSWEPAQIVHQMLQCGLTEAERQYHMCTTPHMPDYQFVYNVQTGSVRNPFSTWTNSAPSEDSRAPQLWLEILPGPAVGFRLICMEPILMSPCVFGEREVQALYGIQNIDLSISLTSTLSHVLSGYLYNSYFKMNQGGTTPTEWGAKINVSPGNVESMRLHITYLQPPASMRVPPRLNYAYNTVRKFETPAAQTVAPGATFNINYNNVTLHEIPRRIIYFAKPRPSTVALAQRYPPAPAQPPFGTPGYRDAINSPDFCAQILRVNINFDVQDSRLSTLESRDLYYLATKNGWKRSWNMWSQFTGSVLPLEMGTDINLSPLLCPSVMGNFQISANIQYRDIRDPGLLEAGQGSNFGTEALEYIGYFIIVPVGVMTISQQMITVSVSTITEKQVLESPWAAVGIREELKNMYGAGSFKSITHAIKKAARKVAPMVHGISGVVGDVLASSSDPRLKNAAMAAKVLSGVTKGNGRRTGGQKVRCASLARRM